MAKVNWKDLRLGGPKERLVYWMKCREEARLRKELDGKPPYTRDPVVGNYKFCNVNREHDRVTVWVRENIREDKFLVAQTTPHLMVMNLAIARLFNHPDTMAEIGLPINNPKHIRNICVNAEARKARGDKMLRGAYLVTPHGGKNKGVKTTDYIARIVGTLCDSIAPYKAFCSLDDIAQTMIEAYGWQAFMVNQICTDLRYTPWFEDAPDWETFVLAGPGTRRGINRYHGASEEKEVLTVKGGQKYYIQEILDIREELRNDYADILGAEILEALRDPNNLSNCFCEFDKFERARACLMNNKRITLKHYK